LFVSTCWSTILAVKTAFLAAVLLLTATLARAGGQNVIPNYATAHRQFFWTKLYVNGGESLYCGVRFKTGQRLTIEHVYSADWIATKFGCQNRDTCPHPNYLFAEADLHNLWPELGAINSSRGDKLFGEIPGRQRSLPRSVADLNCDYERTNGRNAVVEPRDSVKGEIARTLRTLLYMHVEYELPLNGMSPMLKRWNEADPPNRRERWRNKAIELLQGIRNRFIDDPTLVAEIR
jgi:deoxyribonuclease-1